MKAMLEPRMVAANIQVLELVELGGAALSDRTTSASEDVLIEGMDAFQQAPGPKRSSVGSGEPMRTGPTTAARRGPCYHFPVPITDTTPEARAVQLELHRAMTGERKIALAYEMSMFGR